ncbi:hypothetical protein CGRA01v4_04913 [Colletotrichum graminicola]|nr:hypothetical protein CGRA01v4_04913 [Colletotrichum graminicola]
MIRTRMKMASTRLSIRFICWKQRRGHRSNEYYSIDGVTLERVFLNVMNRVNVDEEEKPKARW